MLEPPLGEHRHVEAEDPADSPRDDLALEGVEALGVTLRQLGERNGLGDGDTGGQVNGLKPTNRAPRLAYFATQPGCIRPKYVSECLMESTPQPSWYSMRLFTTLRMVSSVFSSMG